MTDTKSRIESPKSVSLPDPRPGRAPIWPVLGAGFFTGCCLLLFAWLEVDGLWRPDAFDYAQIGRELASGEGFSSRQAIYALHLRFLAENDLLDQPWPNLHRFPLPSIAMASLFLVMGAEDHAVVAYGILFQVACSMLLFAWARNVMGRLPAVGTVLIFSLSGSMLETGCSGLGEPPVLFFFTWALYCLWAMRENDGRPLHFAGAAFGLGLASLARTNVLLTTPVFVIWMLSLGIRREKTLRIPPRVLFGRIGLFLSILLAVLAPWLIRNWRVAGDPMFSLHSFFLLPAGIHGHNQKWNLSNEWVSDFVPPLRFALENSDLVLAKWKTNFVDLLRDYPTLGKTFLVPVIALFGLFFPPGSNLRGLAGSLFLCLLINALVVNFTDQYVDKYYYHFLPCMTLISVGLIWRLSNVLKDRFFKYLVFFAMVGILGNPFGIPATAKSIHWKSGRFLPDQMSFIQNCTEPDDVIFSDLSYAVTWLTGRRTVRAHLYRDAGNTPILAALRLNDEFLPFQGVYLSRSCLQKQIWAEALHNLQQDPRFTRRFPKKHMFENGAVFFYR